MSNSLTIIGDRISDAESLRVEISRLEHLLSEKQEELRELQKEFHEFRMRYAKVVGRYLMELSELEAAIRMEESEDVESPALIKTEGSLKKLFWSVARIFHPDHAKDEGEARNRHAIMVEANRAYEEGDVESLEALLGDNQIVSFCRSGQDEGAAHQLVRLKEEIRTIEFGMKRVKQNSLYNIWLSVIESDKEGRDLLSEMAEDLKRQIFKAKNRLENLKSI
jgi:hypothetical protein